MVLGAARRDLRAVQGLHGAQAVAGRDRPRRPAAVVARAGPRRGDRAAAGGRVRPRADRRVPGRQRPAGGPRARAWAASGCEITAVGDDFQAIYGFRSASRGAHPRLPGALPGHPRGDAGAQLPLDAAGPGRRERGRRPGRAGVPEAPARRPAGRRPAARGLRPRRGRAGRGGLQPRAGGARAGLGPARPGRAGAHLARLATCWSSSCTRRRIPFSSTAGCATWRRRTSRTSWRCCGWPTTAPTTSRGSACCSWSRASGRRARARRSRRWRRRVGRGGRRARRARPSGLVAPTPRAGRQARGVRARRGRRGAAGGGAGPARRVGGGARGRSPPRRARARTR